MDKPHFLALQQHIRENAKTKSFKPMVPKRSYLIVFDKAKALIFWPENTVRLWRQLLRVPSSVTLSRQFFASAQLCHIVAAVVASAQLCHVVAAVVASAQLCHVVAAVVAGSG